jgi:predicted ester cyclase
MPPIPQVIWTYIEGLKYHDVDGIAETVADDLLFITPAVKLNKERFLDMLRALYAAFPDWTYRHDAPVWQDGRIAVKWRQNGTHTGSFALPGLAPIRPTGKAVTISEQQFFYLVADNRIVEIQPDPVPDGAPGGILKQIGVKSPPV